MKLEVTNTANPQQWDEAAVRMGGVIGHSTSYAQYLLAAHPHARVCYYRWVADDGEIAALAVGLETRSPRGVLAFCTRRLSFPTVPLVRTDIEDGLTRFLGELESHARGAGVVEIEIGSSGAKGGQSELESRRYTLTSRLEFELDLSKSEDELWDALKSQCRGHIKKALKMGISLRDCNDAQGINSLRRLQGESSQRIVARGGRDITRKGDEQSDPLQVLLDLGRARLACAEVEGEIVSAALFTEFNEHVYYALSGHSRRALQTQAPSLMLWESIKRYRKQGARVFNLGGCLASAVDENSSEHGVYMYKKAFGTSTVECTSGRKVLRATTYRLVRLLKQATGR